MASRRIAGLTIEIDGNTTKLNDALKSVDKQLSATQSQLKDVERLLKLDPKNTELLAQKQKLLTDAISGTKDRLAELEKAQEQLNKKGSSPELEKQQQALQREIIATKKQLEGFEDELGNIPNRAKIAFDKVGDQLQETGEKISKVGENMTKFVTGPIAGAGAAAVAAFTEVDDAMDTVILKTGATGEAAKEMQEIVEELATTIPTEFGTAADAVGEVSTKFGATGDQLNDLASTFIKFASINKKDVSSSIDNVQKAMNAYGIDIKNTDHFLDLLTKTAQDTGADVDKLAAGIVQNSAAFQEMGLSVDEAVGFMGQLERSGVNSETAMGGLRKALQKATKQGVPLSKVLQDLQHEIKNSDNQTQALTDTYALFSKSGDQIYAAIRNGTLDFENFGETMGEIGPVVDKTFDATVDGVDNWKMAMNEVKLLGSDIGGILSEFAGPILTKVRDALKEAVGWWRELSSEEQENILKAAGIVAAVGPVVTVVGKATTAVGLLSQGLGILAAHPVAAAVIGLTTAFGGLAIAIKDAGDKGDAYMQENYGINESMQANIDKIGELKTAYEESMQKKDEAFQKYTDEAGYLQDLAEEYDSYIGKNGEVMGKYKERAEFIEGEFARIAGLERGEIDEIIKKNGELSSSIDQIIEKRMAEALLTELYDDYYDATIKVKDAEQALLKAEEQKAEADEKVRKLTERKEKLQNLYNEAVATGSLKAGEYNDKLQDLRVDMEYAEAAQREANQAVEDAEETYKGYQATIEQYRGLSAAAVEGDTTKIHNSLETFKQDFRTTETATTNTLKKQVEDYKAEYENTKKAVERGSKTVTQADLAEKQYWYTQAKLEYNKATKAAKDAASDQAGGYAAQLRAGRPKVNKASDYVAGGAIDPLKPLPGKAEDYGYYFDKGLADGIGRNAHLATYAAGNMANAVEDKLRGSLLINSPSKLTEYFGKMMDEGFAIGMDGGRATRAAENLARDMIRPFQDSSATVASTNLSGGSPVAALREALSTMKIEMDDREMGRFVENTVSRAVYA